MSSIECVLIFIEKEPNESIAEEIIEKELVNTVGDYISNGDIKIVTDKKEVKSKIDEVLDMMQEESNFYLQKAKTEKDNNKKINEYHCLGMYYSILSGRYSWQCPTIIDDCWNSYCNTNKDELYKLAEKTKGIAVFCMHN